MSETISSNVLFHFTNSLKIIKSILKHGFSPRYCPEYTLDPDDRSAASERRPPLRAAPMVCFCDLPLSLIRKHLDAYGRFGIGLTKQWGLRNGVAPVAYTHRRARTRPSMLRLTAKAAKGGDNAAANDLKLLTAYTKPFRGPEWRKRRKKKVKHNVRFYDEREWRYVPEVRKGEPLFLGWEDYSNGSVTDKLHKSLRTEHTLRILPDDIMYLIVPYDRAEKRVLELHKYLKNLYSPRDVALVTTTIMTDDCIKEDI
jgi:abortive phage resistance protein AbiGi (putative antitoxin)